MVAGTVGRPCAHGKFGILPTARLAAGDPTGALISLSDGLVAIFHLVTVIAKAEDLTIAMLTIPIMDLITDLQVVIGSTTHWKAEAEIADSFHLMVATLPEQPVRRKQHLADGEAIPLYLKAIRICSRWDAQLLV